jgi:hypothetical protein
MTDVLMPCNRRCLVLRTGSDPLSCVMTVFFVRPCCFLEEHSMMVDLPTLSRASGTSICPVLSWGHDGKEDISSVNSEHNSTIRARCAPVSP